MTSQMRRHSVRRGSKSSQNYAPASYSVKVVILGDVDIGKSSMLLTYLRGQFPTECPPGPMDGHSEFDHMTQEPKVVHHENAEIKLTLVDTYGQDEYERLRERLCASADIYLLCHDVSRSGTFERIRHHWLPEMRKYGAPDVPFLVVGLKSDVRTKAQSDDGFDDCSFTSYTQGLKEAQDLGALQYMECSAKNNPASVQKVLEKGVSVAIHNMASSYDKRTSCAVS